MHKLFLGGNVKHKKKIVFLCYLLTGLSILVFIFLWFDNNINLNIKKILILLLTGLSIGIILESVRILLKNF